MPYIILYLMYIIKYNTKRPMILKLEEKYTCLVLNKIKYLFLFFKFAVNNCLIIKSLLFIIKKKNI